MHQSTTQKNEHMSLQYETGVQSALEQNRETFLKV